MSVIRRALLDTNACLYLLKGQVDPAFTLERGLVSTVSEVELLGYPEITRADEALIRSFLDRFELAELDEPARASAITLRRKYRLRLGDALICGTALSRKASLISHDSDLRRIEELKVLQLPLVA